MARPINPDSGRYELKADPELLKLWAAAASAQGIELASWVRLVLTTAARRTLAKQAPRKKRKP